MDPTSFRSTEQQAATAALARMAVGLRDEARPRAVEDRVGLVLLDLLAVTLAGARTPELGRLVTVAPGPGGDTRTIGSTLRTTPESAAHLDAVAACCLELDEGNKHATGHPAAHVVFAAMAAARLARRPVEGTTFVAAVAAGYEVAARFGRALQRDPRWHTHGNWGATGAATAATLVLGGDEDEVAAAIDASGSLMHVTPWSVVLEGGFVRNLWMAGANRAGVDSARLALAGLATNTGAIRYSLGELVGGLDAADLTRELGEDWLVLQGYAKQHSACSYTHPVIDAVQALRGGASWVAEDIDEIVVRTHHLAEPLVHTEASSRLGAMFSLPFVTAMAVVSDEVDPAAMDPEGPAFPQARELSERVRVELSASYDDLLPGRRAAEVSVRLRDGSTFSLGMPNPVGDVDHFPFGRDALVAKAERLVGTADTDRIREVVGALTGSIDVVAILERLP
jgi:2-methylcitrate dehydratase PrpD